MTPTDADRPQHLQDYDAMMSWATVLYDAIPEHLGPQDMRRNRGEVGEAIVGQWIEKGRPRVRRNQRGGRR